MTCKNDTAFLIEKINKLEMELIELQNVLKKDLSPNVERFLSVQLPYDKVKVSDCSDFERPFDNVRAIFDRETGNLKYIGLIDDLPF